MRRLRFPLSLVLALLMVPSGIPSVALAQQPAFPPPAAYVPPHALGAMVIRPQAILQYPEMPRPELQLFPLEVIEAWGKENFGVNPLALAEVKVVFGMPAGPQPPPLGIVFTLLEDFDPEKISPEWLAAGGPQQVGGRRVYPLTVAEPGMELLLEKIDARTGIIADRMMLQAMRGASAGTGPLAELLTNNPIGSADLHSVIAIGPLRPLLAPAVENPPPDLPPQLHDLVRSASLVNALIVRAKVSAGNLITRYEIVADDAAAAERLQRAAEQAIEYGRTQLMASLETLTAELEPGAITDATAAYYRRVADQTITAMHPKLRGDRLVIDYQASLSIAGMGMLVGMLLPAVQAGRDAARRMSASNNLKQIGLAMHNYYSTFNHLPTAAITSDDGEPLLSWRVAVLPFLESQQLYDRFRLNEPWDSPHNRALITEMPDVFASPGMALRPGHTVYHGAIDKGMAIEPSGKTRFIDFTDGTANTLLVMEGNAASQVPWTSPDYQRLDAGDPLQHFRGARPGGFHGLFSDGSVKFIADTIAPGVFRGLLTRGGGEQIALP